LLFLSFLLIHLLLIIYSLATNGRAGSNTEILSIDPEQSIPEIYTINNYYSVFVLMFKPIQRAPPLQSHSMDNEIYDGDYVLPNPTIKIAIYDNSPLPITDPSSVYLAMDGRRVNLGSMPDSLFTSQSGKSKRFCYVSSDSCNRRTPIIFKGDGCYRNYSDSAATQIQFRVETNLKLLDVFNYPNRLPSETNFTFILTDYAE